MPLFVTALAGGLLLTVVAAVHITAAKYLLRAIQQEQLTWQSRHRSRRSSDDGT